jgi:hypothetical protein
LHERNTFEQTNKSLADNIANLTAQITQLTSEKDELVRENEDLVKHNKNSFQLLRELTTRLMNLQLPPHLLQRVAPYSDAPPQRTGRDVGLLSLEQHQLPATTIPQNSEYQQPSIFQTHPSFHSGSVPTMEDNLFFVEPNIDGDGNTEGVNMEGASLLQVLLRTGAQQ